MSYALSLISVKELKMFVIKKWRVHPAKSYALSLISVKELQKLLVSVVVR